MRHQSLTERVLILHARGMPAERIAEMVGATRKAVGTIIRRARDNADAGILNKPFGTRNTADFRRTTVLIDPDFDHLLQEACHARRATPSALCTLIINTVIRDDLVKAVLDTGEAE
jgi:hypothetical protein